MTAPDPKAGFPGAALSRRSFLYQMAAAGAASAWIVETATQDAKGLQAAAIDNPLLAYPNRDWEKVYRNLYHSDSSFTFLCAPNDTHNCLLRAHVKNGVVTRIAPTFGYGKATDLNGNKSTARCDGPPGARRTRPPGAEWQRNADERLAMLREGRNEHLWSLADRGLRLDVLAFAPGKSPERGERALRIDFALWGAPRRVEKEAVPGTSRTVTKVVVPVAFRQLAFQFLDGKGKLYGEMSGPVEPYMKLADPERFSEDFVPGVLFGTWYVDAFPREAAKAVLSLGVEARGQSGADVSASYKLELPVAEAWQVGQGEAYKAETREAAQ